MAVKAKDLKVGDSVRLCEHNTSLEKDFHYVFGKYYLVTKVMENLMAYIKNEKGHVYGWGGALIFFEKVEEQIFNNFTE